MNIYERILRVITDSTVPEGDPPLPGMSAKNIDLYKNRPSRFSKKKKKKKKKASLPADLRAAAQMGMGLTIRKPKTPKKKK